MCVTTSDVRCKFPFKYDGIDFDSCTLRGNGNTPWCATSVKSDGTYEGWGNCDFEKCVSAQALSGNSIKIALATMALRASAARSGSKGDIIDITLHYLISVPVLFKKIDQNSMRYAIFFAVLLLVIADFGLRYS